VRREIEKDRTETETKVYTVDLQKVLLLPIMHSRKEAFFLSCLVCFNETFAPFEATRQNPNLCVLWNEALQERDTTDIGSSYHKVVRMNRDAKRFLFYANIAVHRIKIEPFTVSF
jgi:hypothetical protein